MNIEIKDEVVDGIITTGLNSQYRDLEDYISRRKSGDEMRSVMFSRDVKEDIKDVKKILKAIRLVHNYYSVQSNHL